jgi:protein-tyrosine phosphatase
MGNLFSGHTSQGLLVTCDVATARNIYNTLNDLTSYLIVLDIRSPAAFKKSHVDLALNPGGLSDMLYHAQQSPFTTVIIYGDSSKQDNTKLLHQFCSCMTRHRTNQQEGPLQVFHLQDFQSFQLEYPFQCTHSPMCEEGRLFPSQITDNIFLSNFGVASSRKVIQTLGITHILNCTTDCPFVGQSTDTADSAQALNVAINSFDTAAAAAAAAPQQVDTATQDDTSNNRTDGDSSILLVRVPVVDEKDQQIHEHFSEAIQFLLSMGAHDRAIIHCKHGQSRSATVAAAYLIHHFNWTVDQALAHLKACRPKVCPNEGFVLQLHAFANK